MKKIVRKSDRIDKVMKTKYCIDCKHFTQFESDSVICLDCVGQTLNAVDQKDRRPNFSMKGVD